MPIVTLTQSIIQKATCPTGRRKEVFADQRVRGLVLEVRATGGKTFYVRYRDGHGAQRHFKIGDPSSVTLDAARTQTVNVMSQVALGVNPFEAKEAKKRVPTLSSFVEDRYLPFVKGSKRSWKSDETLLRNHIVPALGSRRLDSITMGDITAFHHAIKAKGYAPATANRILVLLRYLFNVAIKWGIDGITKNPSRGVDLFKVNNERQTFLSREQVQELFGVLRDSANKELASIVCFLLLTGARKQEALRAEWKEFDFASRVWVIPISKSGIARKVPMSETLIRHLEEMRARATGPYLFPNPDTGKPYVSIFYAWDTARNKVGMGHVRIHDLRHSFASFLVNSGRSLYEVQKLLGHAHIKTTQRYAHLSNETLIAAADAAGQFVGFRQPMPVLEAVAEEVAEAA